LVRADDRDYTGDLWSNVELCMRCCQLGVAVFEDIDERDFNPNISLEVGYMMALRRRVMLLKERRLTALPADVVHKLYRPFDMFHIEATVSAEFSRWVKNDLRLS
jgi:nucleoside 2-deoxyribosyltransferase